MPRGNKDIGKHGEGTQFGKGQDPKEVGKKAKPHGIRNHIRRIGCLEFGPNESLSITSIRNKLHPKGKLKGWEMLAARKFLDAMNGNSAAMQSIEDAFDGKIANKTEIDTGPTLAELIAKSYKLSEESNEEDGNE